MHGCLWPMLRLLLATLTLCGQFDGGISCLIDPLAPVGWVKSGISSVAGGASSVVKGVAKGAKLAYNTANPTQPSTIIVGGTASEPPKSGFSPMGCFMDKEWKRDMGLIGGSGRKMNKATCSQKCGIFSAKYFGLQSRPSEKGILDCWCGHHFGKYGKGTQFDCQNRCPGEESQSQELCGGENYNSVYQRND